MSTSLVNKTTGELVTLASGTRVWIGSKSAHDTAVAQGKMPNNCMVCITDDFPTEWEEVPITIKPDTNQFTIVEIKVYKKGDVVSVSGVVTVKAQMESITIATGLPESNIGNLGLHNTQIIVPTLIGSSTANARATVQKNGDLQLYTSISSGNAYFSGYYFIAN